ncbi:hypothetical protein [Streptomyces sp. NPDC057302]|uniref:hypothetical protein n=1 Tax=Streptomyces sp. NPDC057302 TaxID=3346094 RepID=UPI003633F782
MHTATNVAGQVATPLIVAARENILDRDKYAKATSSPLDGYDEEPADERQPVPVAV